MNDETTTLDQTDEDILTYTVSDEVIEAAAGIEKGAGGYTMWRVPSFRYLPICDLC